MTASLLAGCAGSAPTLSDMSKKDEQVSEETDEPEKKEDKLKDKKGNLAKSIDTGDQSLATRLCGKYIYLAEEGEEEDEYYFVDVVSFAGNLYGFCGQAMAPSEDDEITAYSFWASEFIPYDAAELASEDGDTVKVNELNFSIMSNAGKFWGPGNVGSITLTDEGLWFEGFGETDFLTPADGSGRLFARKGRVEDVFPYLNESMHKGDADLQGYWMLETKGTPVYVYFENSNMYVYKKAPDSEVYFAAGGCDFSGDGFKCIANVLGSGAMPIEWEASYKADGDTLSLEMSGDTIAEELEKKVTLKKIDKSDVHVITKDELELDESSFGMFGEGYEDVPSIEEDGFYGIWTTAVKDRDKAISDAKKLADKGFESYMCYSPEWENLNSDGYYCVTTGRYTTKEEAEADLDKAKAAGFEKAYVKHSGRHKYTTVQYTNFGDLKANASGDRIVLENAMVSFVNMWYPGFDDASNDYRMTLVIDKDTVFDKSADLEFFGNLEKGDQPLEWYSKNLKLMEEDAEKYAQFGPALSGVFEIGINGDHIDRYFGSYWWD